MRNISSEGLAQLATRLGTEPITLIEVAWVAGSRSIFYADRDMGDILGRILSVGNLDNVVNVSKNSSSQSLDITLDDTDGTIKDIFDHHDIHKRDVRVWQTFEGLDFADKFLVFSGKISSPIAWNESDRTIKFTIISQLEDKEIGFSAEEGQFPALPADMVGKAWPMIFGKVLDCPALQVNRAISGTTLTGVGMILGTEGYANAALYSDGSNNDSSAAISAAQMGEQISALWCAMDAWQRAGNSAKASELLDQINSIESQRGSVTGQAASRTACAKKSREDQIAEAERAGGGANPVKILGGEDFPQGVELTIEVGDILLTGSFNGQDFTYTSKAPGPSVQINQPTDPNCGTSTPSGGGTFDYRSEAPGNICRYHGFIVSTSSSASTSPAEMQQLWADAGTDVHIYSDEPITYIVSITPGQVLAVKAFKQFTGERRLVDIPSDLYTVKTQTFGSITAVTIVINRPLSAVYNQGWSDDIYVTFEATAPTYGPNIIDILKHLIGTYTDLTYDSTSFNYVHDKLIPFPANFPILERKNTLTVLQEIAYQARCALWISNGVFYIKYLPEEPSVTAANEITVSDLDASKGIEVELTPTEDIITKMKISWRMSWAPGQTDRVRTKVDPDKSEKLMILRHNVSRYGTQEEEYFWYIYNQPDIIFKCATFWLIRKSHTWKRIRFTTFLQKLNLETFDPVTLAFAGGYVADSSVKAIVEQANYDSASNTIDFECLVPVRSGTMTKYDFYWPSGLPATALWPPPEDEESNDCGGGGIGMDASGDLPVGMSAQINGTGVVWVGGPNVIFGPQSDLGDRHPSDTGFSAQEIINPSNYGVSQVSGKPYVNLKQFFLPPMGKVDLQQLSNGTSIDIATTVISDSSNPSDVHSTLKTVLYGINQDGMLQLNLMSLCADSEHGDSKAKLADVVKIGNEHSDSLCLDSTVYISSDEHDREFDFKFDSEGDKFGAGTAFLKSS